MTNLGMDFRKEVKTQRKMMCLGVKLRSENVRELWVLMPVREGEDLIVSLLWTVILTRQSVLNLLVLQNITLIV